MTIRELRPLGPQITAEDIAAIETKLGARLPAPYRNFMLRHNGGLPEPPRFGKHNIPSILAYFCSIGANETYYDLMVRYKFFRKEVPADVIPIAEDECGNFIFLAIKGKNRGKVYFWDHEGAPEIDDLEALYPGLILNPPDEPEDSRDKSWPGHPDLSLIADNFAKFLDSFHDFDDDETQAKPAKVTPKPSKAKPAAKQPGKKPRKSPKA
jgi:hypothetical protein